VDLSETMQVLAGVIHRNAISGKNQTTHTHLWEDITLKMRAMVGTTDGLIDATHYKAVLLSHASIKHID
jgi:hypothetical protein